LTKFVTHDSGERQTFAGGMQRDVTGDKTRWDLIADGPMLRRWAELLTRGAVKYDPRNWMRAEGYEEAARFRESAFRHFMQWYFGDGDEDHAAAVFFNINGSEYVNKRLADESVGSPFEEDGHRKDAAWPPDNTWFENIEMDEETVALVDDVAGEEPVLGIPSCWSEVVVGAAYGDGGVKEFRAMRGPLPEAYRSSAERWSGAIGRDPRCVDRHQFPLSGASSGIYLVRIPSESE
jgi:hypothetical protein